MVIDFTLNERIMTSDKPNQIAIATAEPMVTIVPNIIPTIIGSIFFLIIFLCLYKGTARATVAGPSKYVMISFARWYSSQEMPPMRKTAIITIVQNKIGMVNREGLFLNTHKERM